MTTSETTTTLAPLDGGGLEDIARHLEDSLRGKWTNLVDGILHVGIRPFLPASEAALHINLRM